MRKLERKSQREKERMNRRGEGSRTRAQGNFCSDDHIAKWRNGQENRFVYVRVKSINGVCTLIPSLFPRPSEYVLNQIRFNEQGT